MQTNLAMWQIAKCKISSNRLNFQGKCVAKPGIWSILKVQKLLPNLNSLWRCRCSTKPSRVSLCQMWYLLSYWSRWVWVQEVHQPRWCRHHSRWCLLSRRCSRLHHQSKLNLYPHLTWCQYQSLKLPIIQRREVHPSRMTCSIWCLCHRLDNSNKKCHRQGKINLVWKCLRQE